MPHVFGKKSLFSGHYQRVATRKRHRRMPLRPIIEALEGRALMASFEGLGFPPTLHTPDGGIVGAATGESNDGSVIVGVGTNDNPTLPYRWTVQMQAQILTNDSIYANMFIQENPGTEFSHGSLISNNLRPYVSTDGSIVSGLVYTGLYASPDVRVFRWVNGATSTIIVNNDFGASTNGTLNALVGMSNDGIAIAGAVEINGVNRAFRWDNGVITLIPGDPASNFNPSAISTDGSVITGVQESFSPNGVSHYQGFLWSSAGVQNFGPVVTLLHYEALPPGARINDPLAVSNAVSPIVVGSESNFNSPEFMNGESGATIWDSSHGLRILQDVLVSDYGLGASLAGWQLTLADKITLDGNTISGVGINPQGLSEAWIVRLSTDIAVDKTATINGSNVDFAYNLTGDPGTFTVNLYQEASTTFDPSDKPIATQQITKPAPNSSGVGAFSLTNIAPDPARPYLLVVADPPDATHSNGLIPESDETNNVASVSYAPLPDIALASPVITGALVNFSYQLAGNPGTFGVSLYHETTPSFVPTDKPLATTTIENPAAGSFGVGSFDLSTITPDATRPYLVIVADPTNVIQEANEANNVVTIAYAPAPPPPVSLPDIAMVSAVINGAILQYEYQISGKPGTFNFGFYRSLSPEFTSSSTFLTTQLADFSGNQTFDLGAYPPDPMGGYLLVVADPTNAIPESNKSNNVVAVLYSPPPSVVSLDSTSIVYSTVNTSSTISFAYHTGNNSQSFRVSLYQSPDPTFDSSKDSLLRTQMVSQAANSSGNGEFTLSFRPDPSKPYLLVIVNPSTFTPQRNGNVHELPAFLITVAQLQRIMTTYSKRGKITSQLSLADAQRYIGPLNEAMEEFRINTPKREAAFLAQIGVEDGDLEGAPRRQSNVGAWEENWTPKKNFHLLGSKRAAHTSTSKQDYFNYWYDKNKNLGNTTRGDGFLYRGRGPLMITGRDNYTRLGKDLQLTTLPTNPDQLLDNANQTDIVTGFRVSAYFVGKYKTIHITTKNAKTISKIFAGSSIPKSILTGPVLEIADSVNTASNASLHDVNHAITYVINGGLNGELKRFDKYKQAISILSEG